MGDVYSGNDFSIERVGDDWRIWRICNADGDQEQIILTTDAMDELRDYFADAGGYGEHRESA